MDENDKLRAGVLPLNPFAGKRLMGAPRNGNGSAPVVALSPARVKPRKSEVAIDPTTDISNGQRLVDTYGKDLRYCGERSAWFVWDGSRWREDAAGDVYWYASQVARRFTVQCAEDGEDAALLKAAKRAEHWTRIRNAVEAAGHDHARRVQVRREELDADPWLLNVRNGTLDLRTGELRPHAREDLLTKVAPTDFAPDAPAPRFLRFLEEVLPDAETRGFLQRFLGYALVGEIRDHVCVFATGNGANGKGTLTETILSVLGGDFSKAVSSRLLTDTGHEEHLTMEAALEGKRLAIASELAKGAKWSEERLKGLTGGDTRDVRRMYENPWNMAPTAKFLITANDKPRARDAEPSFWRRLRVVHFPVSFVGREDTGLRAALDAERSGILAWLVRGCLEWQARGLDAPEAVLAATAEYRKAEDRVAEFLAEQPAGEVAAKELFKAWREWSEARNEPPGSQTAFGRELVRVLGEERRRVSNGKRWNLPGGAP